MFKFIHQIQSSRLMNQPRRFSFSLHSLVAREPTLWVLYQPYLWWGRLKRKELYDDEAGGMLNTSTELVIDGFQGSANTFAAHAFMLSQKQPVKVMHHLHAPVMIIKAIELEIPVLLTIRQPKEAVLSLTSRWTHISVTQGLQSYIGFYAKLLPYAQHYVLSTFELTTQHLDYVVQTVNDKFGTQFDLVDVAKVNSERHQKRKGSPEKEALKQVKKKELLQVSNTKLLAKADALYQAFEKITQPVLRS